MSAETALIYLEVDDEVTSVVRRIRAADRERVVLVVPGRSRATSSVVAIRLLARAGEEASRQVAVVGDALTRSLAGEAGLDVYGSVDDARRAVPASVDTPPKRAAIHVVRGGASHETVDATTSAALPVSHATDADTEARPVAVHRAPARRTTERRRRRGPALAAVLGGMAVLLVGAAVAGAVLLPAATIAIVPARTPLGPVSYELRLDDPERLTGSVDATAPVTASGTYPVQAAASGAVVFFNWTFVPVEVAAGELVAAGSQAFATGETMVVPPGDLTADGRIQAGEGSVGVVAAAIGPAANVDATAIDTVLDDGLAARLRGFPSNPERLVLNPEATAGGVDTTGPEIIQQDVDAARAALAEALDAAVADALAAPQDAIVADSVTPAEPVIEGTEGLPGTRDQESAQISGTLAYDRLVVESETVGEMARQRLSDDRAVLPAGHELLADAAEVTIGEARHKGDAMVVSVSVSAASSPAIDRGGVIDRVRGRSISDARAALADLGDPVIELWPGWVGTVPELDWRIEVRVEGASTDP